MAKLQLSFACGLYDRMQPLYTGEVRPRDRSQFHRHRSAAADFRPDGGREEFDVAEFSSPEFVQRFANKQCPFVAIPVFPSRAFRHGFIAIHRKAGIKTPKDLEGKRVGVPLLTMTAAIYINGLLQHEYGVDLREDPLGPGRHEHRRRAWQPDRAAAAQPDSDRAEPVRQIDERPHRGARGRCHARDQPAGGDPHQPGYRAAVSELRGAGEGLLQAHRDLSDHAPGRDPQGDLREISVRRHQPLSCFRAGRRRSRSRRCSTCARSAT